MKMSRSWLNAAGVNKEIAKSQARGRAPLTEADYTSTPNWHNPDYMWQCSELGVLTSKAKHEKHMGKPIELFRINVAFKIGARHYNVHRSESAKTANTRYFVLDEELPARTIQVPENHPYYSASAAEVGPNVWFKNELKNPKAGAYYMPGHHECGRIMARPTPKMEQKLQDMKTRGVYEDDITNFIDNERHVSFIYYEPMNATETHPYTGSVPFWHPLYAGCDVLVGNMRDEQRSLLRPP